MGTAMSTPVSTYFFVSMLYVQIDPSVLLSTSRNPRKYTLLPTTAPSKRVPPNGESFPAVHPIATSGEDEGVAASATPPDMIKPSALAMVTARTNRIFIP